jgi:hypothetical protein
MSLLKIYYKNKEKAQNQVIKGIPAENNILTNILFNKKAYLKCKKNSSGYKASTASINKTYFLKLFLLI